jgi:hypothetical protein
MFYFNNLSAGYVNRFYSTKRLTNVIKNSCSVSQDLHEVMIGLILGDLCIRKVFRGINARLQFEQGLIHEAYIIHLYELFKDYCNLGLKYSDRKPDSRTGKIYSRVIFQTYSLPCFNNIYDLFYVNGEKRIPLNIGELLTPVGLAYWAMDDGSKHENGFHLNTDSYTLSEVELLIKVLKENFDLNCTSHKRSKDRYRIYIKVDSMNKFRSLVTPHFHSSMMYKLKVKSD